MMDAFYDLSTSQVVVRIQARICHGCFVNDPFDPDMWSVESVCPIHREFDPPLLHTSNPNVSGRENKPPPPPRLERDAESDGSDTLPPLEPDEPDEPIYYSTTPLPSNDDWYNRRYDPPSFDDWNATVGWNPVPVD